MSWVVGAQLHPPSNQLSAFSTSSVRLQRPQTSASGRLLKFSRPRQVARKLRSPTSPIGQLRTVRAELRIAVEQTVAHAQIREGAPSANQLVGAKDQLQDGLC